MLAPPALPEWLPSEVAQEVARIERDIDCNAELLSRLATDKRMKEVWSTLSKRARTNPQISEAWAILRTDVEPPPDYSDALVLFFWRAYTLAALKLRAETFPWPDLPITQYKAQASQLRASAATIRRLDWDYLEHLDFEDRLIKAIEDAANFCDARAETFIKVKAARGPLLIKRNYGNREARGYVRMLAVEMRTLFNLVAPDSTLARVASVALRKEIKRVQVRKWCDSLK
jgi:hypothetical protein